MSPPAATPVLPTPRGTRLANALGVRDSGRALRDFATYLPTKIIPAIAGFLVLPIVARRLAPTELGVLAIAQTLVSAGWIVAGQWLTASITRELPLHRARGDIASFSRTLLRSLGVTALLYVAFAVALGIGAVLSAAVRDNFLLIGAASAGLVAQNLAITIFAASLRPLPYAIVEILARVGGMALGVFLVFEGHKVTGYLTGVAISSCVVGGLALLLSWPRARASAGPDSHGEAVAVPELRSWLSYGFPAGFSNLVTWLLFFLDRYLLAALKSTKAVGLYTVGSVIGDKAVTIPVLAFLTATRPLLITAFERHGREEVQRLMRAYTRVVLLISMPTLAFVLATRHEILLLLVGREHEGLYYAPADKIVPIVAVGSLLFVLTSIGNTGLVIGRHTLPMVYAAAIGLATNTAANLILIPPYGITGAAVASVVGMAGYLAAAQYWAHRHIPWRFPFATFARTLLASSAGFGVAISVMPSVESVRGRMGIAAGLGGAVYVLVLLVLRERSRGASEA